MVVASARNRQPDFGGPEAQQDAEYREAIERGMDPLDVGRMVRQAVLDDDAFIFTHPESRRIVERRYQHDCINKLCEEMGVGRRKLLVEMATGTGKTRTAVALIKRLFEANVITRVLFLVDRIMLAKQTEDAFAEHLPDYPVYVLRAGRRFQDEKRITITTLQSMINV